jgi:hypothetical protein
MEFHFGVGLEAFKTYWSRGNMLNVSSMQIAATSWGKVAFHTQNAARTLVRPLLTLGQAFARQKASSNGNSSDKSPIGSLSED